MSIDLSLIRQCKSCRAVEGKQVIIYKKKRCPLCGSLTQSYEIAKKLKGKDGKKRFPRELAANPAQKEVLTMIEDRCRDFDCPGKVIAIVEGPVVTEYKFAPDRFTRVKKLKALNEDLALPLKVDTVTIRRIGGESALGIAIPNAHRQVVTFQDCLKNVIAHRDDMELPLNFGITADGAPYVEDLATFPHLLISGTTGTGKSVLLNNILCSLLMVRSSKQLRLVLIDPKTVELFPYKGLPHLHGEPASDVYRGLALLDEVDQEMRRRTSNLHILGVQNIKQLNDQIKKSAGEMKDAADKAKEGAAKKILMEKYQEKMSEQWPYIVVVIDEMADLVLQEKKLFTEKLAGIAGQARAAGICVISATQRPSVDILSGKIKVNFPARAAFRMPSAVDSKTAINFKGAETLLGKGDMFLVSPHKSGLQRIHVPHCKAEDRDRMLQLSLEYGHVLSCPADHMNDKPATAAPSQKKGGN